jgi:hypothetical protein
VRRTFPAFPPYGLKSPRAWLTYKQTVGADPRNLRAEFDTVIATLRWEASMNLDRHARALYLMEFLPALGLSIRVARFAV